MHIATVVESRILRNEAAVLLIVVNVSFSPFRTIKITQRRTTVSQIMAKTMMSLLNCKLHFSCDPSLNRIPFYPPRVSICERGADG